MPASKRYLSAKEAAKLLDISVSTLYAYVSRGLIRSEQTAEGKRQRRYYAEDVEKLLARKDGRRNPETLAKDALHWGAPVMDSAITLIDDGQLYYRGQAIETLVKNHTIEKIATLIWLDDMSQSSQLFNLDVHIPAQRYETMLLHMEMDGAELTPLQEMMSLLPSAAADDVSAYDLRPMGVAVTGARIMRLLASVLSGDVPDDMSIPEMLQKGWCPDDERAIPVLNAALIVTADHELNASSFAARVVASAGATPYAAVTAGISALQGIKHGGYTERVNALFNEASASSKLQDVIRGRLRRGDEIPGFGHRLYSDSDPRAKVLLDVLEQHYGDSDEFAFIKETIDTVYKLIGEFPNIDVLLVAVARVLKLPEGSALAIFALGRTIGWIGHAIEQYETDRLIRPRARYVGTHPTQP